MPSDHQMIDVYLEWIGETSMEFKELSSWLRVALSYQTEVWLMSIQLPICRCFLLLPSLESDENYFNDFGYEFIWFCELIWID